MVSSSMGKSYMLVRVAAVLAAALFSSAVALAVEGTAGKNQPIASSQSVVSVAGRSFEMCEPGELLEHSTMTNVDVEMLGARTPHEALERSLGDLRKVYTRESLESAAESHQDADRLFALTRPATDLRAADFARVGEEDKQVVILEAYADSDTYRDRLAIIEKAGDRFATSELAVCASRLFTDPAAVMEIVSGSDS